MLEDDLAFTPALELRELITTKRVPPVELTELYLRRIERLDSSLNSYLTVAHDQAMRAAKAAEAAVLRGDPLGPLHGMPIAVKDLQMTKGLRTTGGSLLFKDRVPDEDSAVTERVRQAGAVILGKTNTPEFGILGATENRLGDDCRNPWNTERTSGGSSGGAGAALAAGLCPLATGGDGGGSIRIPASFCGVYGIKPTQGRVSNYITASATPLANYLTQQGAMSRTVRDSVLLLQVMAGYDSRDPGMLSEAPGDYLAAADRDIKGLRIAWRSDYGYAAVDPEVVEVTSEATGTFEQLDCSVDESNLTFDSPVDPWRVLFVTNAFAAYGHPLETHADQLTWYARESIEGGKAITGADYARALGQRNRMRAQVADLFGNFDLLLTPTMPVTAFPVGQYPRQIGGREVTPVWGFIALTHPINTVGHPAATVPCGFSADGMPIGLHIIGRRGDEETVIAASAAFERARPWAQHRPPVS